VGRASWRCGISALVALATLAASGCGGSHTHPPRSPLTPPRAPRTAPAAVPHGPPTRIVTIRVVDGDTGASVAGAVVRVRGLRRRGASSFAWPRGRAALVTVSAPNYTGKALRLSPGRARSMTVRLFSPSGQWLMYGVTPSRTEDQSSIPVRPPFRIAWGRSLGALLEFPAVVDDGVAYLSNALGELFALSMADGRTLWRYDMHTSAEASSPAVVGATLVAHSKSGRVDILARASGRLLWSRQTEGEIESSPVVEDGVDYLGDWAGHVYALDLRTRRFRWIYDDGCKITASVAVSGDTLYVGDYCGRIVALDRATGRLRWSRSTGSPVYGASAVADGRVFVPSRDTGAVYAFSTSGEFLWDFHTGDTVYSAPAVWRGRVYFGSYDGELYCVSAASGAVLWELPVGGRISGSATVVDGVVYVGSFDHRIVGADARSGRVVFNFPHGEYVAVSGNRGRLLLYGWSTLWAVEPRR
jgi:outer membrane protein assembly factor BamB